MIVQCEWIGLTNIVIRSVYIELARDGSALKFVGPEPALAVSRNDIRRSTRSWLVNQHCVNSRGLGDTQRQAREVISVPCLCDKSRFLSFSRTISRAVTVLPLDSDEASPPDGAVRHSKFRRHAAEGDTSAHM